VTQDVLREGIKEVCHDMLILCHSGYILWMGYLVFLLIIGCDDVLSRRHDDLLVEVLHELRVTKSGEELHLL
jgi:hypothetical protein